MRHTFDLGNGEIHELVIKSEGQDTVIVTKLDNGILIGVYRQGGTLRASYFFHDTDEAQTKSTDVRDTLKKVKEVFDVRWGEVPVKGVIKVLVYRWQKFLKTTKQNFFHTHGDDKLYQEIEMMLGTALLHTAGIEVPKKPEPVGPESETLDEGEKIG